MRLHRVLQICFLAFAMLTPAAFKSSEAVAQISVPPISQEKLQQLIRGLQKSEVVRGMNEKIAIGLGLTHPFTRKNAVHEVHGVTHGMSVSASGPDRLVFYVLTKDGIMRIFATTFKAELVSAATMIDGVVKPVSIASARAHFEVELRLWSGVTLPPPK